MENCKPNVFPFSTPNAFYAHDVATGKTIKIGRELFLYFSNNDSSEAAKKELDAQQKIGNFLPIFPTIKSHPLTDYVEDIVNRTMSKITLQVTQNCNFRCTYCPYTSNSTGMRTHNSKRMSLDTAKRAIDFARDHCVDTSEFMVGFYGGEPTLEFELMKAIVEYSKQVLCGKKVEYNFTTNASLISDEMASFFEENGFVLVVSLDGPKRLNDRNRKLASGKGSAFDATMASLQNIHDNHPKLFEYTTCNMVMDPSCDIDEYFGIVNDYPFLSNRIRVSILEDDHMENKIHASSSFLEKNAYYDFLELLYTINRFDIDLLPNVKVTDMSRTIEACYRDDEQAFSALGEEDFPGGQCIPGAHAPMVTVDGRIVVCERINEESRALNIGSVFTGFDFAAIKRVLNAPGICGFKCKHCFAIKFCSVCVNDCIKGDDFSPVQVKKCDETRDGAEYRIRKRILLKEVAEFYPLSYLGENK